MLSPVAMWRSKKDQNKSSKQKASLKQPKSFIGTINSEQGQKHRVIVTHLLSLTLTREVETELLWFVAQGFDLPLVIGEQFICKTREFQSASYHACLEFTLTTLFHEDFAQEIWLMLLSKLHEFEICQLALSGLERKTRKFHRKSYENCFVGRECTDLLLNYKFVPNRERAVTLGEIWQERGLIQHVTNTKGHTFKDDQLYYTFDEEQIIKHIRLVRRSRNRSKSNRYNSNMTITNIENNSPKMMRNKSNVKKRSHKKHKNSNINLLKQKSKSKDTRISSKDNIFGANTLSDEGSKIMYFMNKEWSDSEKEQVDIVSD